MNAARSDAIVFYGATGDLAYKQIFPALYALAQHDRLDIPVIGVAKADWNLDALRARPGWDWLKSTRRLAGLLNPLGIVRQQVRAGDRRRWCYVLQASQLADLRARYGGAADREEPDGTTLSAFSSPNPVTNGASGDNPYE